MEAYKMIQVITNNTKYSGDGVVTNPINVPRSLDEYEINVVDLNNDAIWKNQGSDYSSIKGIKDFQSISKMIQYSKKTTILILLPQNVRFQYWEIRGKYENSIFLKDMLSHLKDILSNLYSLFQGVNLVYENTSTKLIHKMADAAFFFYFTSDKEILLCSEGSNKPTAIMLGDNIIASTLQIKEYSEMMELLSALGLVQTKQDVPPWLEEIRMFDDNEQFGIIEENNRSIETANQNISTAIEKINKNREYKSILYTNGDELVKVVFEILENMLGCDLSQFIDKKAEDFLFEIGDTVFIGEIKGVNHNVKSENVSQLDVHYQGYLEEHTDKNEEKVKAILVMNHQKNKPLEAREPVHEKQIQLAYRNGSLIIETITLLKLFEQYLFQNKSREDCIHLLCTQKGILNI